MAANTLNILTPSVNNLSDADFRASGRARLRGGRRLGQDDVTGVPREVPRAPDADARGGRPAERHARRELRDHGLPLQQARARPVLPDRSGPTGDGRQRDVLPDRDVLSAAGTRDVSDARLPPVRGRGGHLRRRRRHEGEGREGRRGGARGAARRLPLVLHGRQAVHRRRLTLDRGHPAGRDARVPAGDRLRLPGLGRGVHERDGVDARRRVLGAGGRRARVRRLGQVG